MTKYTWEERDRAVRAARAAGRNVDEYENCDAEDCTVCESFVNEYLPKEQETMINLVYWYFEPIEKDGKFYRHYVYDNLAGEPEYFKATYSYDTAKEANRCFDGPVTGYFIHVDCTSLTSNCLDIVDETEGAITVTWNGQRFAYPCDSFEDGVRRLFDVLNLFPFDVWGLYDMRGKMIRLAGKDRGTTKSPDFPEKVALVERVVDNVNALVQDAWIDGCKQSNKEEFERGYVEGYDAGYGVGADDAARHHVTYELLMCFSPDREELITGHDDPLWLMNRAMNLVGYIGAGMNGSIRFKVQRIVDGSVEGMMVMTTENKIEFEGVS